jgi:hypothetical protein
MRINFWADLLPHSFRYIFARDAPFHGLLILKHKTTLITGENVAEFICLRLFLAMVATPDLSESCWREVAPSTVWVSNVNGTISFQASRVNGFKLPYAKHQGSP